MDPVLLVATLVFAAFYVGLAILTGLGARARGSEPPVVALSAILFPLAWVAWYVHDGEGRRAPRGP